MQREVVTQLQRSIQQAHQLELTLLGQLTQQHNVLAFKQEQLADTVDRCRELALNLGVLKQQLHSFRQDIDSECISIYRDMFEVFQQTGHIYQLKLANAEQELQAEREKNAALTLENDEMKQRMGEIMRSVLACNQGLVPKQQIMRILEEQAEIDKKVNINQLLEQYHSLYMAGESSEESSVQLKESDSQVLSELVPRYSSMMVEQPPPPTRNSSKKKPHIQTDSELEKSFERFPKGLDEKENSLMLPSRVKMLDAHTPKGWSSRVERASKSSRKDSWEWQSSGSKIEDLRKHMYNRRRVL